MLPSLTRGCLGLGTKSRLLYSTLGNFTGQQIRQVHDDSKKKASSDFFRGGSTTVESAYLVSLKKRCAIQEQLLELKDGKSILERERNDFLKQQAVAYEILSFSTLSQGEALKIKLIALKDMLEQNKKTLNDVNQQERDLEELLDHYPDCPVEGSKLNNNKKWWEMWGDAELPFSN